MSGGLPGRAFSRFTGEMASEERADTGSRVSRLLVFVARPYDNTEYPDQSLVIVEE